MRAATLAALLFALCTAGASAGDVYRYIDESGQVHYSDTPPAEDAERLAIRNASTDDVRVDIQKKRLAERQAAKAEERAQKAAEAAQDAERRASKAGDCESARSRLARYQSSHRMYEALEDGERRYYSAEEQTAAIEKARADVSENCGSS